ncbi:bifunctional DNA primase/polymerase [Spirillospora sp. CA-255316]
MTDPLPHPGAAALACARRGWRVFPLTPSDKAPLAGFTDWEANATTDPDLIRAFWTRARYNVGIACGPSGLVVIDLDTPKPGEDPPDEWTMAGVSDGADVLAVLCERHGQPFPFETFTVTTRRGGMHLYFTAPPGSTFRNTTGRYRTGLGWLIDTRANGGYVVAPGSFVDQPDGAGAYTVANPAPAAPLPGWLGDLLTAARAPASPLGAPGQSGAVADLPGYVQAALKGEAARVAEAVPGGRNHALNKAAYNLGRLTGAGILPEDAAREVLWEAVACHLGPDRIADIHPADARATITSALAAGARNPRTITQGEAA